MAPMLRNDEYLSNHDHDLSLFLERNVIIHYSYQKPLYKFLQLLISGVLQGKKQPKHSEKVF